MFTPSCSLVSFDFRHKDHLSKQSHALTDMCLWENKKHTNMRLHAAACLSEVRYKCIKAILRGTFCDCICYIKPCCTINISLHKNIF